MLEAKITEMLKEDTGRHFLDSGGAYGRHWQTNQKIKDFEKRPEINVEIWDNTFELTIDVYHFLCRALDYDDTCERLNKAFDHFCKRPAYENEAYEDCMQAFVQLVFKRQPEMSINTCNKECLLSQTLQFCEIDDLVVLQIHNGCDVRGGYTKPQFFLQADDHSLYSYNDVYAIVKEKVEYDKDQTEAFPNMPKNEPEQLYTNDGFNWYSDNRNCQNVNSFFEVTDRVLFDGLPVEFYTV